MVDIDFHSKEQIPVFVELCLILGKLYFGMWKLKKLEPLLDYMLDVFIEPLNNREGWRDSSKRSVICHFC